jgi:hypothetical protein
MVLQLIVGEPCLENKPQVACHLQPNDQILELGELGQLPLYDDQRHHQGL